MSTMAREAPSMIKSRQECDRFHFLVREYGEKSYWRHNDCVRCSRHCDGGLKVLSLAQPAQDAVKPNKVSEMLCYGDRDSQKKMSTRQRLLSLHLHQSSQCFHEFSRILHSVTRHLRRLSSPSHIFSNSRINSHTICNL